VQSVKIEDSAEYNWRRDRKLIGCGVAALLLLNAALGENGDGYFTFLRIYICGLAAILAFADGRLGRIWLPLSAIMIAILFNPFRPIEMSRESWIWYDMGTAAWFAGVGGVPLWRRVDRNAIKLGVAFAGIFGILALSIIVSVSRSSSDNPTNVMNVDENLTTTDMNAADMNPAAIQEINMDAADTYSTTSTPTTGGTNAAENVSAVGYNPNYSAYYENAATTESQPEAEDSLRNYAAALEHMRRIEAGSLSMDNEAAADANAE
jgi:hypothetical protein